MAIFIAKSNKLSNDFLHPDNFLNNKSCFSKSAMKNK